MIFRVCRGCMQEVARIFAHHVVVTWRCTHGKSVFKLYKIQTKSENHETCRCVLLLHVEAVVKFLRLFGKHVNTSRDSLRPCSTRPHAMLPPTCARSVFGLCCCKLMPAPPWACRISPSSPNLEGGQSSTSSWSHPTPSLPSSCWTRGCWFVWWRVTLCERDNPSPSFVGDGLTPHLRWMFACGARPSNSTLIQTPTKKGLSHPIPIRPLIQTHAKWTQVVSWISMCQWWLNIWQNCE
jgi:hypothetical protein